MTEANEVQVYKEEYQPPRLDLMQEGVIVHIERIAEIMCKARIQVPAHFVGQKADCFAVALQALAWGMSPFIVAQKTHVVKGTLGYEAQLVNAVILSSRLVSGRFKYEWEGIGNDRKCRVGAVIRGESELTWGTWTIYGKQMVKNSSLWKSDPDQQLAYLAVKKWGRLYCPDLIAGVYTPDEIEEFGDGKSTEPQTVTQAAEQVESGQGPDLSGFGTPMTEETVECPQSDGAHVSIYYCDTCKDRQGCPTWAKADESEQKSDAPNMGTPPPSFS